jgi:hypothetical protein
VSAARRGIEDEKEKGKVREWLISPRRRSQQVLRRLRTVLLHAPGNASAATLVIRVENVGSYFAYPNLY